MSQVKAVVLAAGKGTRLRSESCDLPKVLREANGKPLLHYVLEALSFLPKEDIIIVVGYKGDQVRARFPGYPFVEQAEQKGTGHAVQCAEPVLKDFDGTVLVCCGDMPLLKKATYEALLRAHAENRCACTFLTGTSSLELPYGRILRDADGGFLRVVEDKDCTPEQKQIKELNAGVYAFDSKKLFPCLKRLKADNAQGELYLTDVPEMLVKDGICPCFEELGAQIIGVNTPEQLQMVEKLLRNEQ